MVKTLLEALPTEFNFYDIGQVRREELGRQNSERQSDFALSRDAIYFRLDGEYRGGLILFANPFIDGSVLEEIGNIIASQFAGGLAGDVGVIVAAPKWLTPEEMFLLNIHPDQMIRTQYRFQDSDLDVWAFIEKQEVVSRA